jgi:hypothetical protein
VRRERWERHRREVRVGTEVEDVGGRHRLLRGVARVHHDDARRRALLLDGRRLRDYAVVVATVDTPADEAEAAVAGRGFVDGGHGCLDSVGGEWFHRAPVV